MPGIVGSNSIFPLSKKSIVFNTVITLKLPNDQIGFHNLFWF
jgi:hypothetical protein